ncbi:MAG: hypothetical protein LZF86_110903 [Nitrospira sp.]|nr:MAG: hypothetical protein LZF86_110903 [Nitrospira sp.]
MEYPGTLTALLAPSANAVLIRGKINVRRSIFSYNNPVKDHKMNHARSFTSNARKCDGRTSSAIRYLPFPLLRGGRAERSDVGMAGAER